MRSEPGRRPLQEIRPGRKLRRLRCDDRDDEDAHRAEDNGVHNEETEKTKTYEEDTNILFFLR